MPHRQAVAAKDRGKIEPRLERAEMRLVLLVRALDRVSAMGCKVLNEMRAAFSIGDVARGEVNAAIKTILRSRTVLHRR